MSDPSASELSQLASFVEELDFDLDAFQRVACEALERDSGVLVAAPTGAGKTVVGEFAMHLALSSGTKAFYTTPIKALSNQKFTDLCDRFGRHRIGLLTGDTNINSDADIVVMTTEVLRNMIYAGSNTLRRLRYVVMDEVHYLADRSRGSVWEEVIIHLPRQVKVAALSATISNAEEFGQWLNTVRGETEVVVSEERPVPLLQHLMVGDHVMDLFKNPHAPARGGTPQINPELLNSLRTDRAESAGRQLPHRRGRARQYDRSDRGNARTGGPVNIVTRLDREGLLPAIFFIFSRAGCDAAVQKCRQANVRLTSTAEAQRVRAFVNARCADLPAHDLRVLDYDNWLNSLARGIAAHHAGMLPTFKEVVEDLFEQGLVKVVFATETLALGVNMPAKTVVLDKLVKYNGHEHVEITAGEYTQLTGRAGRRGMDTVGHAVVAYRPGMDPKHIAGLASTRTYPLKSSFRPTYNMSVNLLQRMSRQEARATLETSFAQFQADRAAVDLAQRAAAQREALQGYSSAMQCHLGDFAEYAQLRRDVTEAERSVRRMHGAAKDDLLREVAKVRKAIKAHPCHGCVDRESHARWAERFFQLNKDTAGLLRRIENRTGSISRVFDRVCEALVQMEYLQVIHGELMITDHGRTLQRIYGESDLLIAESLRRGIWDRLDAKGLAAVVAALVHSGRGDEVPTVPAISAASVQEAWTDMVTICRDIHAVERQHGIPTLREPDPRSMPAIYRWAHGESLDDVLTISDMTAGDFVRLCRQVVDALDQLRSAAPGSPVALTAAKALGAVDRGVVSYSSGGED